MVFTSTYCTENSKICISFGGAFEIHINGETSRSPQSRNPVHFFSTFQPTPHSTIIAQTIHFIPHITQITASCEFLRQLELQWRTQPSDQKHQDQPQKKSNFPRPPG
uniref:Uncharacterized protein n=1 Tax=Cacopsylla melanoneura TaxID=428564 RepID=A0A8D8QIJ8_9HEMI